MLTELHIENLGVIERLDLVLGPGLTAVTGETGAGKTMLVEALELLVGGRATRPWCERARRTHVSTAASSSVTTKWCSAASCRPTGDPAPTSTTDPRPSVASASWLPGSSISTGSTPTRAC